MPELHDTKNKYGEGQVRNYASLLDPKALDQAKMIARSPVVKHTVALMPDAHFGYGPPVGSALITSGALMPYTVGVDIGCGMIATRLPFERDQLVGKEGEILQAMRDTIPSGMGVSHQEPTYAAHSFLKEYGPPPGLTNSLLFPYFKKRVKGNLLDRAEIQFGTLGGGNHFVELSEDVDTGRVWLVLHSGSRGVGNVLASAWQSVAQEFCEAEGIEVENKEFAYLPEGTKQYEGYRADLMWAQDYAREQRQAMVSNFLSNFKNLGHLNPADTIQCHHNYAEELPAGPEGESQHLIRKGAIDANDGVLGIIPGSMGAETHLVVGLGNPEGLWTAPHGAGRLKSRGDAKRSITVEEFKIQMEGKTWQDRDAETLLDEAPDAYKPIVVVMNDSKTLVATLHIVEQFINYKGV